MQSCFLHCGEHCGPEQWPRPAKQSAVLDTTLLLRMWRRMVEKGERRGGGVERTTSLGNTMGNGQLCGFVGVLDNGRPDVDVA